MAPVLAAAFPYIVQGVIALAGYIGGRLHGAHIAKNAAPPAAPPAGKAAQ